MYSSNWTSNDTHRHSTGKIESVKFLLSKRYTLLSYLEHFAHTNKIRVHGFSLKAQSRNRASVGADTRWSFSTVRKDCVCKKHTGVLLLLFTCTFTMPTVLLIKKVNLHQNHRSVGARRPSPWTKWTNRKILYTPSIKCLRTMCLPNLHADLF